MTGLSDRDRLRALLRQPYAARILLSAVELDLFTPCSPGPASRAQVAQRCATDLRATGVMLEALAALGLLERRGDGFVAGELAARHLCEHSPEPLQGMVFHYLHQWERWTRLSQVVRSGCCVPREERPARSHRDFVHAMDDGKAHRPVADLLPVDLAGVQRAVDLGGGPGTIAVALARALPDAVVTLVDRAETLAVAAERVPAELWGRRVRPLAADLVSWSPPHEGFDLAVLSAVLHSHGVQAARAILERAVACVAPGGRLVIRELLLDDPDPERAQDAAVFSVSMLIGTAAGRSYTGREIRGWMRELGLVEIETLPVERGVALVGRRPSPDPTPPRGNRRRAGSPQG